MLNWRSTLLVGVALAVFVVSALAKPFAQDVAYHLFADQRHFLGVPNFMDVASNVGFLIAGLLGLVTISTSSIRLPSETRLIVQLVFAGVVATALGSGWYHWNPNNASLAWDRLGMVVGFMSLATLVVAEYWSPNYARKLLFPLIALGMASVLYWIYTESLGRGDLRPYAMVQFIPILLIPMVLLMYPERSQLTRSLWWVLAFYVASKLAEHFDAEIFEAGQILSGHSLKHLLAACAPVALWIGLRRSYP